MKINTVHRVLLLLLSSMLCACSPGPVQLTGAVQKGPFVLGSSITIATIDGAANPTGQVFPTETTDDLGEFALTVDYQGFVSIEGSGFYYNEITGELSQAPLTLGAFYHLTSQGQQQAYVNIVTHLTNGRVKQLLATEPFDQAIAQAESELRAALTIGGASFDPHAAGVAMNLAGGDDDADAYLFAVSAILAQIASNQAGGISVDATLQELVNTLSSSFAASGQVDPGLVQQIVAVQVTVNPENIMNMLAQRFASVGSTADVPDLNRVWDSDGNGIPNAIDGCPDCVQLGCIQGHHDDGTGTCVADGMCATGFMDGGDGKCLPAGTCSPGYHLCGGACAAPAFSPAVDYAAGSMPIAMASADLNGDHHLDLVVVDEGGTGVSVLLGNGDGTFKPAISYASDADPQPGVHPFSVAVADFDGDTKLDLAVANYGMPGDVGVLLGNGDGTFQPATDYATGSFPRSVIVADFNLDTKLDLSVIDNSGNVEVLLGNGNGTFQAPIESGPYVIGDVVSGDFNGDGKPDLAFDRGFFDVNPVGNYDFPVGVLLGNGDGTFQTAINSDAGIGEVGLLALDLNGDSKLDLVVGSNVSNVNALAVLLGKGDGTFAAPATYDTGDSAIAFADGDFNGDGKIDLAACGSNNNGAKVSVLLGVGDGTFSAATSFDASTNPQLLVSGDFNEDSKPDLTVIQNSSNDVSVLLNATCVP